MENLYSLVYISLEAKPFSDSDLDELLKKARSKNSALNITGMLLYDDGRFIQTLEGDKSVIEDLYKIIKQDKRHKMAVKIYEAPIKNRYFSDWSMGFKKIDNSSLNPEGFSNIFTDQDSLDKLKKNPSPVIEFLLKFRNQSV